MRDNICVLNGAPRQPQSSLARLAWMTVAGIWTEAGRWFARVVPA